MLQQFPLVISPWLGQSANELWMYYGVAVFGLIACGLVLAATVESRQKHDPPTPRQLRIVYYVALVLLGMALLTMVFGACLVIPVHVVVVGLIIFFGGRTVVDAFGYAFLDWPKPGKTSS